MVHFVEWRSNIMSQAATGQAQTSQTVALSQSKIHDEIAKLPNWSVKGGKLHAEFRFENFVEAFAFMTKVAFAAESVQHHPEWRNVYNRVTIDLSTHDAGDAITQLDLDMARRIDTLVG
jgi:4a-hydroxytetrahydrobiopterin dehydratase